MTVIMYFLIAIFSTTVGAMTGMGGGVIMKPVLDALGDFDVESIAMLSSLVVLTMSVVSVGRQVSKKPEIDATQAVALGMGAIIGGSIGQQMLTAVAKGIEGRQVTALQNIILAIIIICVFLYMLNKDKIKSLNKNGIAPGVIVGIILGIMSSFLGIGGGPMNIAVLIFVLGIDTKQATLNSLIIVFFSQVSKVVLVAATTGFSKFDFSMLLPMAIGAVLGGFIGSAINSKLTIKQLDLAFNCVQILVFCICVFNIGKQLFI